MKCKLVSSIIFQQEKVDARKNQQMHLLSIRKECKNKKRKVRCFLSIIYIVNFIAFYLEEALLHLCLFRFFFSKYGVPHS